MKAKEIIGRNVKRHREIAGLKQVTFAKHLGISTSALSQIERGKTDISITRLEQIAASLGKSFYDLITTPNHVGGIQNHFPKNTDTQLIETVKELIKSVGSLVDKMNKQ